MPWPGVLDLLPSHLVVTSDVVVSELGASARAATGALAELVSAGILNRQARPLATGRMGRQASVFVCLSLLEATGSRPPTPAGR